MVEASQLQEFGHLENLKFCNSLAFGRSVGDSVQCKLAYTLKN